MRSKIILKIVGTIAIVLLLVFVVMTKSATADVPYKQVQLSHNNLVENNVIDKAYDTAVSVALDVAGITGIVVNINELSQEAKKQFDGELKAHVRYYGGQFFIFIISSNHKDAIEILSHEIVHIQQYLDGDFVYDDYSGKVYWKGQESDLENTSYDNRSWEVEAFAKQSDISSKVYDILY